MHRTEAAAPENRLPLGHEIQESSSVLHDPSGSAQLIQPASESCACSKGEPVRDPVARQSFPFVYAIGSVQPRFPNIGIEKEYHQAVGRSDMSGLTDREATHQVLTAKENRYLVRLLCWVMSIEGIETYMLRPRNPDDLDLLVEALRPKSRDIDLDVVIGIRGPVVGPEMCNGLLIPMVAFDQLYSFDVPHLLASLQRPPEIEKAAFEAAAEQLFDRIAHMADNAGATDEHRALNYLAVRYSQIYATASEAFARNFSLTAVEVRPSRLSGLRRIVDVVFTFTHRQTDVAEKHFVRVDVTDEFPFLASKLTPFYAVG